MCAFHEVYNTYQHLSTTPCLVEAISCNTKLRHIHDTRHASASFASSASSFYFEYDFRRPVEESWVYRDDKVQAFLHIRR